MAVFTNDLLNELEENTDFSHIEQIKSEEWFILRFYFFYKNLRKDFKKTSLGTKLKSSLYLVTAILSILKLLFSKQNQQLVIANNAEIVKIGDIAQQKLLFTDLVKRESIFLEKFTTYQKPISGNRVISFLMIQILEHLFARFFTLGSTQRSNTEVLVRSLTTHRKEFMISEFNPAYVLKRFNFYFFVWDKLLRWLNPKEILLTDYYNVGNLGLIKAAKKLNIKVIELQHGTISQAHTAYFFSKKVSRALTPDHLLYFLPINFGGKGGENFYLNSKDVTRVSHPLILPMTHKEPQLQMLKNDLNKKFSKIVLITLQDTTEKEISKIILEVAPEFKHVYFILLPRTYYNSDKPMVENVTVDWQHNFYELLQIADLHVTHYSTCAIEADLLKVKSVCIDYENMASKTFAGLFEGNPNFLLLNYKNDFVNFLKKFESNL